jgi:hypothetical protein
MPVQRALPGFAAVEEVVLGRPKRARSEEEAPIHSPRSMCAGLAWNRKENDPHGTVKPVSDTLERIMRSRAARFEEFGLEVET